MTMLTILQHPDPRLRKKAKTVTDFNDPQLQQDIDNMVETLYHTANCAGLAATQLDIADPFRVTVIDVSEEKNELYVMVNPEVLSIEGELEEQWEGCMSVWPDEIHGKVMRPTKINARYYDREGKKYEIEATGILAKCISHECDHLAGKLYIDLLSPLKRQLIERKIAKIKRSLED